MPVLRNLKQRDNSLSGFRLGQLILAAPDVDRDTFTNMLRDIVGMAEGITLFTASNDRALEVSRQFWGGVPRAGDVPAEGPLVIPGVDSIDVTSTNTRYFSLNHSGYAETSTILGDIRKLLIRGYVPPGSAIPTFEKSKRRQEVTGGMCRDSARPRQPARSRP